MWPMRKPGPLPPCVAGGRWLLLTLFFIFAGVSHAATCLEYTVSATSWYPTKEAACSAADIGQDSDEYWTYTVSGATVVGEMCQYQETECRTGGGQCYGPTTKFAHIITRDRVCEDVCTAGKKQTLNFTVGYHATPATNTALNPFVIVDPFYKRLQADKGASICYQGCKIGVPSNDSDVGWISQVAGPNGLYRSSVDIVTQSTSQQCSVDPNADESKSLSPGTAPPTCPGSLGTVNGATVCLPSIADAGIDGGGEARRGNPSAGPKDETKSPSERAKGPGGDGNGSSPTGSNGGGPTGGPATGTNNGSTGKGCNDGSKSPTPACSGKGTNDQDGTKPTTPGKEQANCGAPGQAKCAIDETGTPDGKSAFDKGNKARDEAWDKHKTEFDKMMTGDDEDTKWGVMPSWIRTGACNPWHLGTLPVINAQITIDICPIKAVVDAVMGFLWALGTFIAVYTMVGRTVTQSSI